MARCLKIDDSFLLKYKERQVDSLMNSAFDMLCDRKPSNKPEDWRNRDRLQSLSHLIKSLAPEDNPFCI